MRNWQIDGVANGRSVSRDTPWSRPPPRHQSESEDSAEMRIRRAIAAGADPATLARGGRSGGSGTGAWLIALQRQYGNRYVQTVMEAARGPRIDRKCSCGRAASLGGECTECGTKREGKVGAFRSESPPRIPSPAPDDRETLHPLTRALIENRFSNRVSEAVVQSDDGRSSRTTTLRLGDPGAGSSALDKRAALTGAPPNDGELQTEPLRLHAQVKTERPTYSARTSMLTEEGAAVAAGNGDEIVRLAQFDDAAPDADSGVVADQGDAGQARFGQVGSCAYQITYANLRNSGCGTGQCGAQIVFDITRACGIGAGCPNIDGLRLTESVTTDNGCGPGSVTTGAGCPIRSHPPFLPSCGELSGCTDTYALCGPAASFPAAGCTEKYTQKLFIGGVLAETHVITFTISRGASGCTGSVART